MPTTPIYALRYPASTDPADVPTDMGELAADVETAINAKAHSVELAYAQITANVTVSGAEASPVDLVTAPAFTFDGSTIVIIEVYFPAIVPAAAAGATMGINLWETTDLGRIGQVNNPATGSLAVPFIGRRRLTPSAGAHTYRARGWMVGGNATVVAGAGGPGASLPGYIRITRA